MPFFSSGEEAKEDIEFNIKSPDGKSLEMMPVRDQCEVRWKFQNSSGNIVIIFPMKESKKRERLGRVVQRPISTIVKLMHN